MRGGGVRIPYPPSPLRPVTALFARRAPGVIEVEVAAVGGGEVDRLAATADHPFATAAGAWVRAAELRRGTVLRSHRGLVQVLSVKGRMEEREVFNLEVEGAHTYMVGWQGVVVHNGGDCGGEELADNAKASPQDPNDVFPEFPSYRGMTGSETASLGLGLHGAGVTAAFGSFGLDYPRGFGSIARNLQAFSRAPVPVRMAVLGTGVALLGLDMALPESFSGFISDTMRIEQSRTSYLFYQSNWNRPFAAIPTHP